MSSEKITFYEQVLELEPESRLFFPLARLYFEKNDLDKSRKTLLNGLDNHPQHFEARLLLAAILNQQGQKKDADSIYQDIFSLLSNNADFWESLSRNLSQDGKTDLSLAAAFFAGSCSGKTLTWADIMQAGMKSIQDGLDPQPLEETVLAFPDENLVVSDNEADKMSEPHENIIEQASGQDQGTLQEQQNFPQETNNHESISQPSAEMFEKQKPGLVPEPDPGLMENYLKAKEILTGKKTQPPSPQADADVSSGKAAPSEHEPDALSPTQAAEPEKPAPAPDWQDEKFEEPEEINDFDITNEARTRSMADLLFNQEEYAKALDIYTELLPESTHGEEKEYLEDMILRAEQAINAEKMTGSKAENIENQHKTEDEGSERNGALSFLMALADRLEAKSV